MGRAILLTGRPGVGKTTVIRKVLARWEGGAGGFYTEEIREEGRRTGFRLVTLDGARGILASVNISSPYRVGKYGVDLHDLEEVGVEALNRAVEQAGVSLLVPDEAHRSRRVPSRTDLIVSDEAHRSRRVPSRTDLIVSDEAHRSRRGPSRTDLIVIDEVGRMELFSPAFREAVERALGSPKLVLGTVMAGSHPWVDAIKARPEVNLVEVTALNRSTLPEQILRGLLQS